MPDGVKPNRHYNSPRRREQAAATRGLILDVAQRLFERDGYAATSMAAIAAEAGVALKTVYVVFETKAGLLRAVWHRLLRGDEDDIPVGEQPWYQEVIGEADPERQLRLNARNSRIVKVRAGALMEAIRGAAPADPEIRLLWERIQAEFHANQRSIVESLHEKAALKPDLDVASAADILWAINHPSVYQLLVADRGWTPERYEEWLADTFCSQLLRESGHASAGRP
jgi:AcrR family transcriptional regulator